MLYASQKAIVLTTFFIDCCKLRNAVNYKPDVEDFEHFVYNKAGHTLLFF